MHAQLGGNFDRLAGDDRVGLRVDCRENYRVTGGTVNSESGANGRTPVIKGFLAVTGGLFNRPTKLIQETVRKVSRGCRLYLVPNGAAVARSVTPSTRRPT